MNSVTVAQGKKLTKTHMGNNIDAGEGESGVSTDGMMGVEVVLAVCDHDHSGLAYQKMCFRISGEHFCGVVDSLG